MMILNINVLLAHLNVMIQTLVQMAIMLTNSKISSQLPIPSCRLGIGRSCLLRYLIKIKKLERSS